MATKTAQRILNILNRKRDPVPTAKVNKCRACRFKSNCPECNIKSE